MFAELPVGLAADLMCVTDGPANTAPLDVEGLFAAMTHAGALVESVRGD